MKKDNKKFLLGILVGILLFGGISVAAITLTAEEVTYSPSDSNFDVSNTKEAIDELYKMVESNSITNRVKIGSGSTSGTKKFDISGYEGCENFTINNFGLILTSIKLVEQSGSGVKKENTYDATTCTLSIGALYSPNMLSCGTYRTYANYDVYLYY